LTGDRIAPAIGQFGLQDTRGGGADEDTDTPGAIAFTGNRDRLSKTVLIQAQPGQPVIAAIEQRGTGSV